MIPNRSHLWIVFGTCSALALVLAPRPATPQEKAPEKPAPAATQPAAKFEIPRPLKVEHDELHEQLVAAIEVGGQVGEAASAVAKLLHPHFVKEEEYALPPLGLLVAVADGKTVPEMKQVLKLTDQLRAELPQMLAEHKAIVAALAQLKAAAQAEQNQPVTRFAEQLVLHAQTEEQVLYPAAIVLGEYLKTRP